MTKPSSAISERRFRSRISIANMLDELAAGSRDEFASRAVKAAALLAKSLL